MQKFLPAILTGIFTLSACIHLGTPGPQSTASLIPPVPTSRPASHGNAFLTATIVPPISPVSSPTLAGPLATIVVYFDMGSGSSGFDSMIYGQEVFSGKTFHAFMSVGDHHAEAVFRVEPVTLLVEAPGTYVFYARLTYVPEIYHWGATGCPPLTECPSAALKAIDVLPDLTYEVTISDRSAVLPVSDEPVTVPWER